MSTTESDLQILSFAEGIPGFPDLKNFVVVDIVEDGAFQELRSPDDDEFSMIVCVPWLFFPDYAPELGEDAQDQLAITSPDDAIVFCPVTVDVDGDGIYLNLLGPFVVNAQTNQGRQLVLADSEYPVRAPIELGGS